MKVQNMKLSDIKPYENNPRINDNAVDKVAKSIEEFGFQQPIVVDKNLVIIVGHTRYKASQKLGLQEVPVVVADTLSDEQVKAYRLADNKTNEFAEWDYELLNIELEDILNIDMEDFGFLGKGENDHFWGDATGETNEEYQQFTEKFKPKLTTDDCYTPRKIYEAVKNWAIDKYGLSGRNIVRPFYPGGDYINEKYHKNDVVIDNPPFSIISEICRFYIDNKIDFFLFAPNLTLFSTASGICNYIVVGYDVVYENGASVNTSFVTNMGNYKIETSPILYKELKKANKDETEELSKYDYPQNVLTSARLCTLVKNGCEIKIKNGHFIRSLDCQKEIKKGIYGGGFLISDKEKEKMIKEKEKNEHGILSFELSKREKEIINSLE